jgi:glycosyltransferase involved in cell wall biosynthesis
MRVSIVLAVHNGSVHLSEQIESILQGSQLPDEWIIVDDASTDQSPTLAKSLLASLGNARVKFLRNEQNIGATRSFVSAVLGSTGDIVLFCDQDDIWHPLKIATVHKAFLADDELVMVYHDGDIIDAHGLPDGRTIWGTRSHALLALGNKRDHMDVAANPDVKGCTMAVKGDLVRHLFRISPPNFAEYWGHDHWSALMAWGSGKVRAIPERLIRHRLHGGNTSAATRFSPLSPEHWSRRLSAMRRQASDHFVQRYQIASSTARSLMPTFDRDLLAALDRHGSYALRRMDLKQRNFLARVHLARGLWTDGYYQRYFNGRWTLLRDVLA